MATSSSIGGGAMFGWQTICVIAIVHTMLFALLSDEINENSPIDDLFPVLFLFHVKTKLRDVARIIAAAEAAFCINKESPNLAIGRILHEYLHNSPYASSVCLVSMHNVI
jgi:hypothetical protein